MWDNMSGFWRMQCADDSFEITAKVRSENLKINSKTMCLLLFSELWFFLFYFDCLLLKYNWNISALFTLPGPSRERKGVANILGENHMFCYFFIPNILGENLVFRYLLFPNILGRTHFAFWSPTIAISGPLHECKRKVFSLAGGPQWTFCGIKKDTS